jgi:hypothetical protein
MIGNDFIIDSIGMDSCFSFEIFVLNLPEIFSTYFQVPCFVHSHQFSTFVFKFIVLYTPITPLFIFEFVVLDTTITLSLLLSSFLLLRRPLCSSWAYIYKFIFFFFSRLCPICTRHFYVLTALLYCSLVHRYKCCFTSSSAVHFPSPSSSPLPIPSDSISQIYRLILLTLFFTYILSIPCLITTIL